MKKKLEKIKEKYLNDEITAENALREVFTLLGIKGSACKCMYHEWTDPKEDGRCYCSNCGELTLDLKAKK